MLNNICKREDINITSKSINKIIDYCDGDLRKAINTLQRLKFLSVSKINDNILNDISIKINIKNFSNLIKKLETKISYQNIINITRFL